MSHASTRIRRPCCSVPYIIQDETRRSPSKNAYGSSLVVRAARPTGTKTTSIDERLQGACRNQGELGEGDPCERKQVKLSLYFPIDIIITQPTVR